MGEAYYSKWFWSFLFVFSLFAAVVMVKNFSGSEINKDANSLSGFATHSQYSSFSEKVPGFVFNNISNLVLVSDTVIYRTGYYSINGSDWQNFSLSGNSYNSNSNWLRSSGSVYLPDLGNGEHYVIVYSCTYNGSNSSWDCHGGRWQLMIIIKNEIGTKYLVQNGAAVADIVISPDAPNMVGLAGDLFQMYIYNMTGATLPLSNNPNPSYNFHVYIGQSNYTDAMGINDEGCQYGGFKMISGEDYLVLLGNDDEFPDAGGNSVNAAHDIAEGDERGSMNAVYSFLYNQGMRWYAPISIGTIIPQKQNIAFSQVNELNNPDFALRGPYIYYKTFGHLATYLYPDFDMYLQWQLAQGWNSIDEFTTDGFVHGIGLLIYNATMQVEHPEYYAIWDGVRQNAPDLCSQGLFDANVQFVRNLIQTRNATMISVMPTDGFTRASESSQECLARETPERGFEGIISDYTFEYVNNVAWEIYNEYGVDRKILCAAYGAYLLPPLNLSKPLAPNLQIVLTKWRSDNAVESTKNYYDGLTNQWLEYFETNNYLTNNTETNKFYTYDYYLINRWESTTQAVPAYFPHIIEEDLQFLKGKSEGEFMEAYSNWPEYALQWDSFAATALNLYVTSRMYWDVDQDVDDVLNEYYTLYYGSAANEMKAFVEYSEANYANARHDPQVQKTLRQMANNALDVAGENTIEGRRINELLKLINSNYIGEETTINSCQTLSSASTKYVLTNDVSSGTGNCFFIDADDITLDCQGHTITYSTSGVRADDHGIYINANWHTSRGDFFNITNCTILDGSYLTGNTTGSAILNSEADFGTIEYTRINVSGEGIIVFGGALNRYKNNAVYANTGDAFFVQYGSWQGSDTISTNIFENNIFSSVSGQGAYIYRPNNDTIINNTFSSVSSNGLNFFYSVNCNLENNIMSSQVAGRGFYSSSPTNLNAINNTITP